MTDQPTPHQLRAPASGDSRSLAELFKALAADATHLARQEMALAKAEVAAAAAQVLQASKWLAVGGAAAMAGALVFLVFLVVLLGQLLDERFWLSSLMIAAVLLAAGTVMARHGLGKLAGLELRPAHLGDAAAVGAAARRKTSGSLPKRVWNEFREDDITGQAAKVAYYAFLALPPAFLVLFGLTGFFGGQGAANWLTDTLRSSLPASASQLIADFVSDVVYDTAPGPFSVGLVLALWAASNVFMGLGDTLNAAYDTTDSRPWVKRRAIAVAVMGATVLLFLGGSAMLLAGPQIAGALNLFGAANLVWTIVQWPLALLLVIGAFWVIYYALPDRDQRDAKMIILKGAAFAAVLWVLATAAFRIYISNFSSYSDTYGFLGAVIVLLLWLYLTGIVLLLGGELNAELERG